MTKKPALIISSIDAARLEALLDSLPLAAFPEREALEEELARARIVQPQEMPPTVVTMNSTVKFTVEGTNEEFCLTHRAAGAGERAQDVINLQALLGCEG